MNTKELAGDAFYRLCFPDDATKAQAFEQIAQHYYFSNFGTMSKAELELLMFNICLERLKELNPDDMSAYSDYRLSKALAITQSRVSSLKERAALKYPSMEADWKAVFQCCAEKARHENGKVMIYLPDRTIYLEVRNAIEENGGYSEKTLTPNLLQVPVEYYVDLMLLIRSSNDRRQVLTELRDALGTGRADEEILEEKSISELLKEKGIEFTKDIGSLIPVPWLTKPVSDLVDILVEVVRRKKKKQ